MLRIRRYIPNSVQSRNSSTDQKFKSLHASFDEYVLSGKLDISSLQPSYDFKSEEDVDFNKPLPHDVELLDVACGRASAFPIKSDPSGSDNLESEDNKDPEGKISETTDPNRDPEE